MEELGNILGINFTGGIPKETENIETKVKIKKEEIERLIKDRETARANKDFARADEIRDYLQVKGIILEDRKEGTIWKLRGSRDG